MVSCRLYTTIIRQISMAHCDDDIYICMCVYACECLCMCVCILRSLSNTHSKWWWLLYGKLVSFREKSCSVWLHCSTPGICGSFFAGIKDSLIFAPNQIQHGVILMSGPRTNRNSCLPPLKMLDLLRIHFYGRLRHKTITIQGGTTKLSP